LEGEGREEGVMGKGEVGRRGMGRVNFEEDEQ
jgi:hypothetical protein